MHLVTLAAAAYETIAAEARRSADGKETGGILLGHDHDGELLVSAAGDPGPDAERAARRFRRDLKHAQALADAAYRRDGSVWIGEWHTHPDGQVEPSAVDLGTYLSHLADASLGFDRFLSLIVVPCPEHGWSHSTIAAWVVQDRNAELATIRTEEQRG
jgi:integrative and conjugative element protein (TIGR02256 family)